MWRNKNVRFPRFKEPTCGGTWHGWLGHTKGSFCLHLPDNPSHTLPIGPIQSRPTLGLVSVIKFDFHQFGSSFQVLYLETIHLQLRSIKWMGSLSSTKCGNIHFFGIAAFPLLQWTTPLEVLLKSHTTKLPPSPVGHGPIDSLRVPPS